MTFAELYRMIEERKRTLPEGSNTTKLMRHGLHSILPKLNEESYEVGLALEHEGPEEVALEVSQCFYYLICLAVFSGLPLEKLDFDPVVTTLPADKHDLTKLLSREMALLCHEPWLENLNRIPPCLLRALELGGASREQMEACL